MTLIEEDKRLSLSQSSPAKYQSKRPAEEILIPNSKECLQQFLSDKLISLKQSSNKSIKRAEEKQALELQSLEDSSEMNDYSIPIDW